MGDRSWLGRGGAVERDFGADEPRAHSPFVGARSSLMDDEARRQQMIRERAIEVSYKEMMMMPFNCSYRNKNV